MTRPYARPHGDAKLNSYNTHQAFDRASLTATVSYLSPATGRQPQTGAASRTTSIKLGCGQVKDQCTSASVAASQRCSGDFDLLRAPRGVGQRLRDVLGFKIWILETISSRVPPVSPIGTNGEVGAAVCVDEEAASEDPRAGGDDRVHPASVRARVLLVGEEDVRIGLRVNRPAA